MTARTGRVRKTLSSNMHILVSNDDGYESSGIRCLMKALRPMGKITVVAPERNRSGASNSLTLDMPLRIRRHADAVVSVDGTPTDCVHLAITGLLDEEPDMVVSGINEGANLGDDVLYSGTVAAATEGRFLGLPAIAISNVSLKPRHMGTAGKVASRLVEMLAEHPLPADSILNVNVPDLPWEAIRGYKATRLGHRHRAEPVIKDSDPRGRPIYWIGPAGEEQDAGPDTDFHAVREGYVSITPLKIDLTRHDALPSIRDWIEQI